MAVNIEGLINEVSKCCLGESQCGKCDMENCLIGYCKKMLTTSLKQNTEYIDDGVENLPYYDTKIYDEVDTTEAIGYLLNQCRNCNLYHDEACIINIIRSALEIILLGEAQEYKGSVLIYLNDIKQINEKVSDSIFQAFHRIKNKNQ
ncbi:MAG: hypothetical protein GX892_05765 [Thermoanaerobacteraceae bacterium]|nr:hypothetical protein [Thermoanaerobacteraceae bacterium]